MKEEQIIFVSYPNWGTVPIQMTVAEYKQFLEDKANGLVD